jgi:hypothetical protein
MTPQEVVDHARDFFVKRFEAFVATQRRAFESGTAELLVEEVREAYQGLCRLDFATDDKAFVFVPDQKLSMKPVFLPMPAATCIADHLDWQDIVILSDQQAATLELLEEWFFYWFDPEGAVQQGLREPGVVHLLSLDVCRMDIDMGTAPAEALWQMLWILDKAGAKNIYVTNSESADELHAEVMAQLESSR